MSKLIKKIELDHFNKLIPILAKKHNITEKETELIMRAQWEFLKLELESGLFNNIKIKHIGKWIFKEKMVGKTGNRRLGESSITKSRNLQNRITKISTEEKKDM